MAKRVLEELQETLIMGSECCSIVVIKARGQFLGRCISLTATQK
jgi:hypothetical protein